MIGWDETTLFVDKGQPQEVAWYDGKPATVGSTSYVCCRLRAGLRQFPYML